MKVVTSGTFEWCFWFLIVSGNQVFDHVVSIEKEVGFVCAYATDPYKLTIRDGFFLMV